MVGRRLEEEKEEICWLEEEDKVSIDETFAKHWTIRTYALHDTGYCHGFKFVDKIGSFG